MQIVRSLRMLKSKRDSIHVVFVFGSRIVLLHSLCSCLFYSPTVFCQGSWEISRLSGNATFFLSRFVTFFRLLRMTLIECCIRALVRWIRLSWAGFGWVKVGRDLVKLPYLSLRRRHYFGRGVTQEIMRWFFFAAEKTKSLPAVEFSKIDTAQRNKGITTSEMESIYLSTLVDTSSVP